MVNIFLLLISVSLIQATYVQIAHFNTDFSTTIVSRTPGWSYQYSTSSNGPRINMPQYTAQCLPSWNPARGCCLIDPGSVLHPHCSPYCEPVVYWEHDTTTNYMFSEYTVNFVQNHGGQCGAASGDGVYFFMLFTTFPGKRIWQSRWCGNL